MEEITDINGPVTQSTPAVKYLKLPENIVTHIIDSEMNLNKLDLLKESLKDDEPIGIDSEWRPTMNVFHQTQGPSIL